MAQRKVGVRWISSGNGALTLELHIPVQAHQPDPRQTPWTEQDKQRIARVVIDTSLQPLEAIEHDGLPK